MAESKLNIQSIDSYSEIVSRKLSENFFRAKKTITGQEILNVSPIKQINYFVLKSLFTQWQAEVSKLESPYFDYKNEDVKKSLQNLMNVLSQNILIEEGSFPPLLKAAISETLFLILSPYDYYHQNVEESPALTIKYLRSQAKYIRINKHLYMNFLDELEHEENDGVLEKKLVLEKLDTIFKQTSEGPEDIENYINAFEKIHPLKAEDFFADETPTVEEVAEIKLTDEEEEEINEIQHNLFQDFEEMDEIAIEKSKQQLNDRYSNEQKTINESLATEKVDVATALAASKRVESLQKSISVNQRYMFVKELFEGESEAFEGAITSIEECETFEDAVGLLVQNYARTYHWDMQSVEIKDFLKVIIKKFK